MKTIYIVEGANGEGLYEGETTFLVCAFTEKRKAKQLVKDLIELEKYNEEFQDRIYHDGPSVYRSSGQKEEWFQNNYNPPEHLTYARQYIKFDGIDNPFSNNSYYCYETILHE